VGNRFALLEEPTENKNKKELEIVSQPQQAMEVEASPENLKRN